MTLARQWGGQRPFEETWFVEALIGPDRGLWVRYVMDAASETAEVWALLSTRGGEVIAHKETVPLSEVVGPLFQAGPGRLERDRCVGSVGPLQWDLQLDDRGPRHRHIPLPLRLLPVGRTYTPAALDLRVSGTLTVNGKTERIASSPGVLGHLWGARSRVKRWTWAHCNAFDREDLVFEGISAEIGPLGALTSVVLLADGHTYAFSRTRDLFRTWSRFDAQGGSWSFEAKRGGRTLTGQAVLVPERCAIVSYPRHGVFCANTRFAELRVVLRDPERGVDLDIQSRECAFEIADPEEMGSVMV